MAAFALGVALVTIEMQLLALARAVPIAVSGVILIQRVFQVSAWKAHHFFNLWHCELAKK